MLVSFISVPVSKGTVRIPISDMSNLIKVDELEQLAMVKAMNMAALYLNN